MGRLDDKVVLITGAASGIGEGTARQVIEQGGKVVIADLQADKGVALASELGSDATAIKCDVTLEEDIAAAVDHAVVHFGRLDGMVNNAGIVGAVGKVAETDVAAFDFTMNILARAVFLGMKHAARVMQPQKSGSIVSLSSTAGVIGGLGPHAYTMAKHGVVGLTKSVASELAADRIRVNAVAPGNTVSAMTSAVIAGDPEATEAAAESIASGSLLGIAGMPIDIALAITYLLSEEARYISGHTLVVDGGQTTNGMAGGFNTAEPDLIRENGQTGMAD